MHSNLNFTGKKNGQVLIITALAMVFLMGCSALVLDVGLVTVQKSKLQNAADSAAMAAVIDLPSAGVASDTARNYAVSNGLENSDITVITPYAGDANKIKVICKKEVPYTFARALGFTSKVVTAEAIAKKSPWEGEALPFINLDDDYLDNPEIEAWEKVNPGDFESIDNYEIIYPDDPALVNFRIDYWNGVELKKGTVATVKQEVGYIYDRSDTVYLLSLSSSVLQSGRVLIKGNPDSTKFITDLKNNDVIHPSQLVLLKCDLHDYDYKGKSLYLTYLGEEYDIYERDFPSDFAGTGSMLIAE